MLNVLLTEALEIAVTDAAHRSGLSINEYMAAVCSDALSLEIDQARFDSYLAGTPGVAHDKVNAWFDDLAAGNRSECPR